MNTQRVAINNENMSTSRYNPSFKQGHVRPRGEVRPKKKKSMPNNYEPFMHVWRLYVDPDIQQVF